MSTKKDILFICQYFYPEYISSATLPYDTAVKLANSGFTVDALVGYPNEYNIEKNIKKTEKVNGINISRIKYLSLDRKKKLGRMINYFSFTFSILTNILKLRKYKSVIFYSNPPVIPIVGIISKKIFRNKIVFVSYDIYPEIAIKTGILKEESLISKLMTLINKSLFKNVDKVIALSNEMKNFIVNNRKIKAEKVEVIPNWYINKESVELNLELVNQKIRDFFEDDKTYISYFGNLGTAQDLETILETIRNLKRQKSIHFVFVGHGNKFEVLRNIILKEQLTNVTIIDFLHGIDYEYALKKSNALLVTLNKGVSGLAVPSKTYSYMASGKLIISVMDKDTDIAQDLIGNEAGFNVEINDVSSLTEIIKRISENSLLQKQYGMNCRRVFEEKYTTNICTDKYVEVFRELLEEENDVPK